MGCDGADQKQTRYFFGKQRVRPTQSFSHTPSDKNGMTRKTWIDDVVFWGTILSLSLSFWAWCDVVKADSPESPSLREPTPRPGEPRKHESSPPQVRPITPVGTNVGTKIGRKQPSNTISTNQDPDKQDEFMQGVVFIRRAEWEKALVVLEQVKQKQTFAADLFRRSELLLYLGLSYIHLLQQQRGIRAFQDAFSLNPCIQLPTGLDLSPQIRALFDKTSQPYQNACQQQKAALARRQDVPPRRQPPSRPIERRSTPRVHDDFKPSRNIRLSAWLVLGTGVVTLSTAFVFGGLALWDEVQRNEQPMTITGTDQYLDFDRRARERATVANIMFGASGILLFTGFALHISQWIQPLVPPTTPRKPDSSRILFSE